ncbi:MAG: ribosome small subunit-dependent GTPase A [Bdellovibrionia bacterium]
MKLIELGWSARWDSFSDRSVVRITAKHKSHLEALAPNGDRVNCYLKGAMQYAAESSADLPVIGDWCAITPLFVDEMNHPAAMVEEILPRANRISRIAAGPKVDEQVLAANVDVAFIVTSVNADFNINRLRRFLLVATTGGVEPIIVFSKIDLAEGAAESASPASLETWLAPVRESFPELKVIFTSAADRRGVEELQAQIGPGRTAVFLGTSGVGKSSLVNALLGRTEQSTGDIRDDDRGRHTTSGGKMFFVEGGGMIIDTAGLREIQVVGSDGDLEELMPAVAALAAKCKFSDCTHESEPECAVRAAIEAGELTAGEMRQYEKLLREMAYQRQRLDVNLRKESQRKWKVMNKGLRLRKKLEGR